MSDIWNEFEKIACAQGLVSVDQDEDGLVSEAQDEGRKQEDPSKMPTRYDSVADDAIRLLYGIEPDSIYDKDKTIIENAHPETAVVGRTYDAMNAVVENLHQRQDMMAYIAQKMPNGHLTMRRYVAAKQDLVNSLVRSAFLLDNREESELMALADSCSQRLGSHEPEIVKEALGPLAIAGIAGAAGVLLAGANYFINGAPTAQNVYANSQLVLEALNPLMDQPYARSIASNVRELMKRTKRMISLRGAFSQIDDVGKAIRVVNNPAAQTKAEALQKHIENHLNYLQSFMQVIPGWVSAIKNSAGLSTDTESDWYSKLKNLTGYLVNSKEQWLIKTLAGEKFLGFGSQTGGLLEAIKNDIAAWSSELQGAGQQVQGMGRVQPQKQQHWPLQQPAPQTPMAQTPMAQAPAAGGLPASTPAPQPSAPGTPIQSPPAAAARRPQPKSPLEELANQWGG